MPSIVIEWNCILQRLATYSSWAKSNQWNWPTDVGLWQHLVGAGFGYRCLPCATVWTNTGGGQVLAPAHPLLTWPGSFCPTARTGWLPLMYSSDDREKSCPYITFYLIYCLTCLDSGWFLMCLNGQCLICKGNQETNWSSAQIRNVACWCTSFYFKANGYSIYNCFGPAGFDTLYPHIQSGRSQI